jgi:hypothetical protein
MALQPERPYLQQEATFHEEHTPLSKCNQAGDGKNTVQKNCHDKMLLKPSPTLFIPCSMANFVIVTEDKNRT